MSQFLHTHLRETIVKLGGICAAGIMKLFADRLAGLASQRAIVTYTSMERQNVYLIIEK